MGGCSILLVSMRPFVVDIPLVCLLDFCFSLSMDGTKAYGGVGGRLTTPYMVNSYTGFH